MKTEQDIIQGLNELYELRCFDIQAEIKNAISNLAELSDADKETVLTQVEASFNKQNDIEDAKKKLETEIKEATTNICQNVKGVNLEVRYVPHKVSWDTKALAGYAVAHPEILTFQKPGLPYASIYTIKQK